MSISEPRFSARELAAFAAAVETGSVHGAAEALDLTQSAATKRIRCLERRVGAQLLDRGRFGVTPTELGRRLYPEATAVLVALTAAERVVTSTANPSRLLRLAASQTIGEVLLPGWLAAFRATVGHVHVQLDVRNSPAVLSALRAGDVEIGFVEDADPLEGCHILPLVADEIVAVVGPKHPWVRRRTVSAASLERELFFTREAGSGTRSVVEKALAAVGVTLTPALELASTQSLKRSVLDGGFTLLSRLAVEADHESGTLVALSVTGVHLRRELRAARLLSQRPADPAQRFWRFLEATR